MTPIKIIKHRKEDDIWHFKVAIGYPDDQTVHRVTLAEDYYQKLTSEKISADQLVVNSFNFLLKREPKESILHQFDLSIINTYFPEYENTIKQ